MPITGDVKYSALSSDHPPATGDGLWVLLDGRSLSELDPTVVPQLEPLLWTNATAIPDANGKFPRMDTSAATLSSTGATGDMIERRHLPTDQITVTTSNEGGHSHYMFVNASAEEGLPRLHDLENRNKHVVARGYVITEPGSSSFEYDMVAFSADTNGAIPNFPTLGKNEYTGEHTHEVLFSLNPTGTQDAFRPIPAAFVLNAFIYAARS